MTDHPESLTQRIAELEEQVSSLDAINAVLIERVETAVDNLGSAFSVFERNILLEKYVGERTTELKQANLDLQREIADRRRAESALQKSEEHYRSLFENMLEGFAFCEMIFDAAGGPIDWIYRNVNAAFGRITGLSDVVGKRATELFPGIMELHPELLQIYGRVARQGTSAELETEFVPLKPFFHISVFSPSPDHFVAVFEDITERKKAEFEKEHLEVRLRQAQKMEAIGTLAGGIAHDFNNILTPIMAYTEMTLSQHADDPLTSEDLNRVMEAALRAKDLVRQILTFSRQTGSEQHALSPAPVIKEALKLLRASLPATIRMVDQIQNDTGVIVADPSQIH